MKKKIAKQWVKALRSGKYKQGVDRLNIDNEYFCCLGVLCEISLKERIVAKSKIPMNGVVGFTYGNESEVLPKDVKKWAGMTSNKILNNFYTKNDVKGHSFKKIAKFIENNIARI